MSSKVKHLLRHASQRANERYGLQLTRNDHEAICRIIREGHAIVLEKQSNTKTKYALEYKGQWLAVVYSKKLKCLYTCLPDVVLAKYATRFKKVAKEVRANETAKVEAPAENKTEVQPQGVQKPKGPSYTPSPYTAEQRAEKQRRNAERAYLRRAERDAQKMEREMLDKQYLQEVLGPPNGDISEAIAKIFEEEGYGG